MLAAWLSCGWVSIPLDHSLSREALTPLHSAHGWSIGRVALAFVYVWDADKAVNWTLSERLRTYLMALPLTDFLRHLGGLHVPFSGAYGEFCVLVRLDAF